MERPSQAKARRGFTDTHVSGTNTQGEEALHEEAQATKHLELNL